jgi:hypothetical protein
LKNPPRPRRPRKQKIEDEDEKENEDEGEVLNPQVRQGIADGVDDLDEPGIRFLEAIHRRAQTLKRMVK